MRKLLMILGLLAHTAQAVPVEDFGEPNLARLKTHLQQLQNDNRPLRITQLGDSHTAGDYLSDTLRQRFQQRFGDGGSGWMAPVNIPGQRSARTGAQNSGFMLNNSRKGSDADFPLGGFIATPTQAGSRIRIAPYQADSQLWRVRFLLRNPPGETSGELEIDDGSGSRKLATPAGGTRWQQQEQKLHLPFTITANSNNAPALGGIDLLRIAPGVVVDNIGSNGAQLSIWQRWGNDWPQQLAALDSDLVILAYGTNEAFDDDLDPQQYKNTLQTAITTLRHALPEAAILLLGVPDAARRGGRNSNECSPGRPQQLATVKQIQQQIAHSNQLLYWDWEAAMGGACSIGHWQQQQLARPDLVHFTPAGYSKLGNALFDALMQLLHP